MHTFNLFYYFPQDNTQWDNKTPTRFNAPGRIDVLNRSLPMQARALTLTFRNVNYVD